MTLQQILDELQPDIKQAFLEQLNNKSIAIDATTEEILTAVGDCITKVIPLIEGNAKLPVMERLKVYGLLNQLPAAIAQELKAN